jgi:hypothetical protein
VIVTSVNVSGQQLIKTKTFLNHQVAEAYSCQLWNDTLYVALEGGVVAKLNSRLEHVGWVDELRDRCIVELFETRNVLFARSFNHELFALTKGRPWRKIAHMDCYQFLDSSNTVHILQESTVFKIDSVSDDVKLTTVVELSTNTDSVTTFAIVGDTVIVSLMNASDVFIQLVNGDVIKNTNFWKVFEERYFAMSDGSIYFLAGGEQAGWFRVGATPRDQVIWYAGGMRGAPMYTRAVVYDGKVGVVGSSVPAGDSALALHLYKSAMSPDTVWALGRLHTTRPIAACSVDTAWACASSFGRFAIAGAVGGRVIKEFFPYMWKNANLNVTHLENDEPAGSGSLQCFDFDFETAAYSTNGVDTVEFPAGTTNVPRFGHTVRRGDDGSEVIIFNDQVWYRSERSHEWEKTTDIITHAIEDYEVRYYAPSTVILSQWFRSCDVSTDNGRSWRSSNGWKQNVFLGEVYSDQDHLVTSGNRVLRFFKISGLPDDPDLGSIDFHFEESAFEYLSMDSSTVRFIGLKSNIDTVFPSTRIDRFVLYTWAPRSGALDSQVITLDEPIAANSSGTMFACEYRDTVNIWLDNASRFLRIANGRVVSDTTLDIRKDWSLAREPSRALLSKDGVWWIVYRDKNIAFGLDVSHGGRLVTVSESIGTIGLSVYPNPATSHIEICYDSRDIGSESTIDIIDLSGRIVYSAVTRDSSMSIDVSTVQAGLYSVVVKNGHTLSVKPVIISR